MRSMFGMCFNWKVLACLGAVATGVLVFAPNAALAVLPLLLLAACPLSMVGMMFAMKAMGSKKEKDEGASSVPTEATIEALRSRLRDEERQLERELSSHTDAVDAAELSSTASTPRPAASS